MLIAFASSRLLVFSVILLSRLIVIPGPFSHRGGFLTTLLVGGGVPFLEVARDGYPTGPGSEWGMGVFPVYPLLVRIVSVVFHNIAVAGVVTANLSLLMAGVLLDRLIKVQHANADAARTGVLFLMFNPGSVFYAGVHPNSTFLMIALASLYAAAKGRWLLASVCGMALAATHQIGVLIVLPLLIEFVQQSRSRRPAKRLVRTRATTRAWSWPSAWLPFASLCSSPSVAVRSNSRRTSGQRIFRLGRRWRFEVAPASASPKNLTTLPTTLHRRTSVLWLALIPLATIAFIYFGYVKFPDAAAVSRAINAWLGSPVDPWSKLFVIRGNSRMYSWLLPPIVGASLLLWAAGFALKIRLSSMIYATLVIALYMCSTILEATPRSIGLVFPLFVALGLISTRWKWTYEPLLALSVAVLTFCTMVVANGYWMG